MRKARLATLIDDADIQPAIAPPFAGGATRAPQELLAKVERRARHGLLIVAGAIPSIYRCAESVCIQDTRPSCYSRPSRARRGKDHGGITCAANPFSGRASAS